jgi:uncharacterized membrane protein
MKALFAPIMIGMLALACASPATAAGQSGTVGVATAGAATDDKNNYLQQTKDEMRIWDQKLRDFNAKVQTKATEAETKASKNLDAAWTDTKNAASRLETAGEADWAKAKASFKTASAKLAVAWQKANPADK